MFLTNCCCKTFLEFTSQYLFNEYEKVLFAKIFSFFCYETLQVFDMSENFKERLLDLLHVSITFPYSHKPCYFGVEGKIYQHLFITL